LRRSAASASPPVPPPPDALELGQHEIEDLRRAYFQRAFFEEFSSGSVHDNEGRGESLHHCESTRESDAPIEFSF